MSDYLEVLQKKAKKIGANIEECGFDKDCIKDVLANKVRSNLEHENLNTIKEKALAIEADIFFCKEDKKLILDVIEKRVKNILEEENERFTSIELQKDFMPLDLA